MKPKIKIAVFGFYELEPLRVERIFQIFSKKYDLEISDNPDLVFYSSMALHEGGEHLKHKCLKVFVTSEPERPDFRICDYSFHWDDTDERNFHLPYYAVHPYFEQLRTKQFKGEVKKFRQHDKSRFCAFVVSNPKNKERIEFCKKLMAYKKVDCAGKVLNNMPRLEPFWKKEVAFFKRYKFTIAFESSSMTNYTTEKNYRPLLVGSIPIYQGNPRIAEHFNPEAFINCHDYDNFDQVIKRVIEVDNDDALYQKYVNAPAILKGSKAYAITEKAIMERLDKIVNSIGAVTPVSKRLSYKLRLPLYKLDRLQLIARSKLQLGRRLKKLISS